jgi:EAL domain-containing protein (putative c-di-GMP-specific phosphodiesterase class I)
MLSNPEDGKLVEAIVSFSHALGLAATAEGIESVEVRDRLKELGCNTGQGFYYSEPQPYAEVQRYLGDLHPKPRLIA